MGILIANNVIPLYENSKKGKYLSVSPPDFYAL